MRFIILSIIVFVLTVIGASATFAQGISIDFGDSSSLGLGSIQILVLITVLSLVPGLAIMITCFPFLVTVLSILRQAIGLQQSPPNMLIVSLALFLTYFVMEPVFSTAWVQGIEPFADGTIEINVAIEKTLDPFRRFMAARTDADTFSTLAELRGEASNAEQPSPGSPLSVLVPSFLLSEIEKAFQIGFLIFLPFLIIDLVVAAVLMSMGMMMVPPAMVSLPFKLAFFVVSDGWTLISEALVKSYF